VRHLQGAGGEGEVDHGAANPFALMDFERDDGKTLACCATLQSDTTIEADIDDEPDARVIPVRDFHTTVSRIETLTPTIKAIHLQLDKPIDFQAGSVRAAGTPGMVRAVPFSIANAREQPRPQAIETERAHLPGGAGTTWLHEQLKAGDTLRVSGPLRPLLRARIGADCHAVHGRRLGAVQPARHDPGSASNRGCTCPSRWSTASATAELYYDDEFRALAEQHANFTYVPACRTNPADWDGARASCTTPPRRPLRRQLRGPQGLPVRTAAMIEACITTLMQGRLFERDIYTEKFITAADAQATAQSPVQAGVSDVRLSPPKGAVNVSVQP
jgi:phenol/toluene 2-monooxygenase (NADH) P5/A5